MAGPLSGFRVLDLSAVVSGPLTGALLADQGADVIKVERTGDGDIQRHVGSRRNGYSGFFHVLNRGKRSIAVDLGTADGVDIVRRLARDADVVIQNFRPGVVDRLGIGYAALSADNPGLVYLSISGFGQTGPRAGERAYDPIIQCYAGLAEVQGRIHSDHPDQPEQVNMLLLDKLTACHRLPGDHRCPARPLEDRPKASTSSSRCSIPRSRSRGRRRRGPHHAGRRGRTTSADRRLRHHDALPRRLGCDHDPVEGRVRRPVPGLRRLPHIAEDPRFATMDARMKHRLELRAVLETEVADAAATMTLAEAASA
jgi:crotonobetainyl-CoA:carnitine CoA-transferase CaiB-like acyl-CoA transferase